MTPYIVAYDLRNIEGSQDYQPLWDYLEAHGAHRVQESLWFLASNLSASEIVSRIESLVHKKDRIFVGELVKNNMWHSPMLGTHDWEKAHPPVR